MIDKLCAINLNYLLMKQSILIQQASLSDIEAVVRKVLDDILDDLASEERRFYPASYSYGGCEDVADFFANFGRLDKTRNDSRSTNRKTCPLCYFRYREYFRRKEGRT